jgi:hypothetical protein
MDEEQRWEMKRAEAMGELYNDHFQFMRFMESLSASLCSRMTTDEVAAIAEDYMQTGKKWLKDKRKAVEDAIAAERGLPKDDGNG